MTSSRQGIYERFIRPYFFNMDPEDAHLLAHKLAPALSIARAQTEIWYSQLSPRLAVELAGAKLSNPLGLAAGFDKNGDLVEYLRLMGFGFAEIGSVTARPSPGNPRPRIFRLLEDEAVINYMGLNGQGAIKVAGKLAVAHPSVPLSINIAKTNDPSIVGDRAVEDFVNSFKAVKDLSVIYVAINVSCPNTHETKLAEVATIDAVLAEVVKLNSRKLPLFLKLSPDSDTEMLQNVAQVAAKHELAGFICGNTSVDRSAVKTAEETLRTIGPGGLSGPPIREKALAVCRQMWELKQDGQQIIACGGIGSGADAFRFIQAGATAVQLYTALVYGGPFLPFTILKELGAILDDRKLTVAEAVGSGNRKQLPARI
ncbi:quinone-dependent dihydroorotate dehydrogenase [Candidatus Obscuribacterales bacterium]|nr:quinone-dependent dihydroorotate dehydrogenase [Candidatus Obscuribacterales bacterium]MBX3148802.1 quinone-dependent dihydroorotate dehydrogenase [Candidatus Obscuribacterales bacterium]